MAKKIRVVTSSVSDKLESRPRPQVVVSSENPATVSRLTENERKARVQRYATSSMFGGRSKGMPGLGLGMRTASGDTIDSGTSNFYSPQLSTDFLEKPQNLRERRAFYRFFYNTNEIVGQAIDIHSTLPLSKLRLVPPKGKNPHQNKYIMQFFEKMCDEMKLFKTLIEVTHEYLLFGNCAVAGSLVRTPERYKKIEDIKIDDLVYTHNSRWRPVLKTISRKAESLLKITTKGFGDLTLTEEHPVELIDKKTGGRKFVFSGSVCAGDFIRISVPSEPCEITEESRELVEREVFIRNASFENLPGSYMDGVDGSLGVEIQTIEKLKGDVVYNFEVEEDHTYQVAGFSTHNCFCFLEEDDPFENMTPEELSRKKEEVEQRSVFLKQKYEISDKNPLFAGWKKLIVLPPDQVRVRKLPLTDEIAVEYTPDPQTKEFITQGGYSYQGNSPNEQKKYQIPADLQDKVRQSGVIPLDTDPYSGSFVFHLARKKSQYEPLGVSIIERCINTLILLDKLRQAQTSIASRHMTPMRVVWAEDLNEADVDNLRGQVDMALVDPDFSIIANYEIHWEEMGSSGRLLDIEGENTAGLDRLLAGLGLTREILTGEGSYTGSRIGLEIMNTQYMLFREVIQDFIENYLFKPIAKKKGFIEFDDYGNEVLLFPKLSFTRLAIRDNDHFFDAAFQLYQKGSISIDLILDILNIDPISTKEKIEHDLFTVNDSIFNELMRNIYTGLATPLVESTDLTEKVAKYLKLTLKAPEAEAPEGAQRFSSEKKASPLAVTALDTDNNELISSADREKAVKMAKIMKYLKDNPGLLEKVFTNVEKHSPST